MVLKKMMKMKKKLWFCGVLREK
ncbi:hypothetical protein A2U01_0112934, partial [Trifolium medium]|nr:hypothetical protein [Trifolium medium]